MVRSVQVGRPHFSRCCYLRIDLGSHPYHMGAGPGLGRSHLNSAVELGSSGSTSTPRRFPLCGCCAVAHSLLRSPTTCAAARPACVPPQPPLASWHSFLRARPTSIPSAADRCPARRVRVCNARLAPSAFVDNGLLP